MLIRKKDMQKKMLKLKNNKLNGSQLIIIGSLLIIAGISCIGFKYGYEYFQNKKDENLMEVFYDNQLKNIKNSADALEGSKEEKYVAVIKIPKINLERGIYSKYSYNNNIDKNILLMSDSDMPDKEKGNVILAGHSGTSRVAYFKNLDKLNRNDKVSVLYNGKEYQYKVVSIYEVEKTGRVSVFRNEEKKTLTLITCKKNANEQIIIICEEEK